MSSIKDVNQVEEWIKVAYKVSGERGDFPSDFSTSYVRNVLSRVNLLHNEAKLNAEQAKYHLNELRIYLVYESGRKPGTKVYNNEVLAQLNLIELGNLESVRDFSQFVEATVAFLKFYGLSEKESPARSKSSINSNAQRGHSGAPRSGGHGGGKPAGNFRNNYQK